jgi:glycosyltransferase involved in cell wall biosynthesis
MDLFLLPSRFEGLPLALVEAQAAGLKCIVSDKVSREAKMSSGMKFLPIDQGTDIWVSEIQKNTLSSRLVASKEASIALSKAGYDIRRNALELQGIYKHCVFLK